MEHNIILENEKKSYFMLRIPHCSSVLCGSHTAGTVISLAPPRGTTAATGCRTAMAAQKCKTWEVAAGRFPCERRRLVANHSPRLTTVECGIDSATHVGPAALAHRDVWAQGRGTAASGTTRRRRRRLRLTCPWGCSRLDLVLG